jgi:uncharacterized membrane protein
MTRLVELHPQGLIFWPVVFVVLALLVSFGVYLAGRVRRKSLQQEPTAADLMAKFRELHSQGVLSDAEFRTIKTTLTTQLRTELRDNGEAG